MTENNQKRLFFYINRYDWVLVTDNPLTQKTPYSIKIVHKS